MGACAILPRLIGHGRASELLFSGRFMSAEEGDRWGFHNRIVPPEDLMNVAMEMARALAAGPTWAHGITKTQLNTEWAVSLDVALEMEAQAQAICMQTQDFRRAYEAFVERRKPVFAGD
jgi:enoyl-CoA hydratase/carnithine racemase